MPNVQVLCQTTRYVANQYYEVGKEYSMPAERAGKYAQDFRGLTDSDRVEAIAAWQARTAEEAEKEALYREATYFDPGLLKAAALVLQDLAAKGALGALTQPAAEMPVRGGKAVVA